MAGTGLLNQISMFDQAVFGVSVRLISSSWGLITELLIWSRCAGRSGELSNTEIRQLSHLRLRNFSWFAAAPRQACVWSHLTAESTFLWSSARAWRTIGGKSSAARCRVKKIRRCNAWIWNMAVDFNEFSGQVFILLLLSSRCNKTLTHHLNHHFELGTGFETPQ